MTSYEPSSQINTATTGNMEPLDQPYADEAPPVGVTPPQVLAQEAAQGRRGAAWRLLYWVTQNDPRTIIAISSLEDDRLAQYLLEFIAFGTWAGKPFVVPEPLRTPLARTHLRTLFLPGAGMDSVRAERVLLSAVTDKRAAMRENAAHILGIMGSRAATPALIPLLNDLQPAVRQQSARALGRIGGEPAVQALLGALRGADEQLGSRIFSAFVQIGNEAVPALLQQSSSTVPWVRWQSIRALGEICDNRALPTLVSALRDKDHSVAWVSARNLARFGKRAVEPLLRLLITTETSPWLVETASYVLRELYVRDPKLKPYLEPVVQSMHGVAYQIATPNAARNALSQLTADGLVGSA
ncbi:MAG TPA: HEAT repeat domain-containing protein [Ktedonosporobacter sp.]|nr:HEAT repeat domain-containing protein [Ktedonosporobacter sp.]